MTKIIYWLVALLMPIFLGFSAIRLVISDAYPRYEYAKANFPPDPFGFTQEERLALASVAIDYLQRPEPADELIFMLAEQRIPGTDEPLYAEPELEHMVDVKRVTDTILRINRVAGVIVVGGLAFLLARSQTRRLAYRALFHGGAFTVMVLLAIALFILVSWDTFFVEFHELLFPPGSWQFSHSSGLIRLFPEKFWFDFGVLLCAGTLVAGVLTAAIGYLLLRTTAS